MYSIYCTIRYLSFDSNLRLNLFFSFLNINSMVRNSRMILEQTMTSTRIKSKRHTVWYSNQATTNNITNLLCCWMVLFIHCLPIQTYNTYRLLAMQHSHKISHIQRNVDVVESANRFFMLSFTTDIMCIYFFNLLAHICLLAFNPVEITTTGRCCWQE